MKTKFRVCIIGNGMIANSAHIPAYRHLPDDFEIVGVCDIRENAARETAARCGLDTYYTNAEEMLDKCKPDLVSVCTPNNFHKPMTILALEHGAHVICEKPIALTLRDAKEMYATAERCGKLLFANQSMRFRADFMAAKDMIDKGMLGDIYYSEFARIRRRGVPRWGMFHIKEMNGGGAFCDIGVHFLDAMNWMLGNPEVLSVTGNSQAIISHLKDDVPPTLSDSGAYGGVFTPRPYKDEEFSVEEFASGYIRFKGNKSCSFKAAWAINQPEQFDIRLSGDKAGIYLPEGKLYSTSGGYLTDVQPRIVDESPYKATQPFFMHFHLFDNVIQVLRNEGEYLIKKEEILNISGAIEAFYRSSDEGREITISELEK